VNRPGAPGNIKVRNSPMREIKRLELRSLASAAGKGSN
jgi:hypothetical protein